MAEPPVPVAHFDHVHLNVRDPQASARYYAPPRFEPGPVRFNGVAAPAPSALISPIWHIGWGALDTRAEYQRQLSLGTKYSQPPTNLPEAGANFYYSYVEGPDKEMVELNNNTHTRFGHIHLLAEDPIAAAEWYMKYFGIKTSNGRPLARRVVRLGGADIGFTANLTIDGIYLGIFPVSWAREYYAVDWKDAKELVSSAGRVIDHIAFSVPDVKALMARMEADGVKRLSLPKRDDDSGVYIEGPDKIVIELVQAK